MRKWIALLFALVMVTAMASTASAAWENSGGGWWYSYDNGGYARNEWLNDGGWYYFDDAGWMVTGWKQIGGSWYYFDGGGAMQTGWLQQGDAWYYLTGGGAMAAGTTLTIDGAEYTFDDAGVWQAQPVPAGQTGWVNQDGAWYYYEESGTAVTGWKQVDSIWYFFGDDGTMTTGWKQLGGVWYYFEPSGVMATGWLKDGTAWYYFENSGTMKTGWLQQGDVWYYLTDSGAMAAGTTLMIDGTECTFDNNGIWQDKGQTGWISTDGGYIYILDTGERAAGWLEIEGAHYFFDEDGLMKTGWLTQGTDRYYLDASGAMVTGTVIIDNETCTFDESGKYVWPHRHITVEVFQRGDSDPANTAFARYIQQNMLEKYNVEVEFVAVQRWTETDEIEQMLAAGNAPDISYSYANRVNTEYGSAGFLTDLTPLLEQYKDQLPNLVALLGDENLYWNLDSETGNLWSVAAKYQLSGRLSTFIRKDWLDKLGLPLPTTKAEFEACLIAFRDNAALLLGDDAENMVPYTTSADISWRNNNITASYVPDSITDEELYVMGYDSNQQLLPGAKEAARLLNKWYNEDLIWKNFGLYGNDVSTETEMMKAGYVGAFQNSFDYPYRDGEDSIDAVLKRNVGEEAEYVAVDCFENDAGEYRKYMNGMAGISIFMPATNDEQLASLQYLDFISSPEAITFLQTGAEGVNHERAEDGAYLMKDVDATSEYKFISNYNLDYTMTVNGLCLGKDTDATISHTYGSVDPSLVSTSLAVAKNGVRTAKHYNLPAEDENDYNIQSTLNQQRDSLLNKAVTTTVAQFDSVYDEELAEYMKLGGQKIINERIKQLTNAGYHYEKK